MNYEFSLSKTASISLIAGSVFISVLLFGAGLVVGSQWLVSDSTSAETIAKNEKTDVPAEPVLREEKPSVPKTPTAPNITAPAAPGAVGAPAKPPAAQQLAATSAETTPAAAAPGANGEVKIIQEADPATDENAASAPDFVTVQIGVFLDEKDADRLLKEVERKGYAPSFFSGRDAEARQWYAVRIGAYSDKQQAANAAANFTKQEKMKAEVRPLGSL
jgi:septal ring-binding cell division protein DamX